jgi:D-lactate dehydrogenase
MRVAMFSSKAYDRRSFDQQNRTFGHELVYLEPRLGADTAGLAHGCPAVCIFVNDTADAATLERLAQGGTRLIALRCAGFNNVDLEAAERLGLTVARVPAYSPHAVSEFTVGLILTLGRQIHRAWNRVRENNFALDGLLGFDLHGKTVGVVGTGRIGALVARTLALGFGCTVLAHDVETSGDLIALGVRYVPMDELASRSDIITLHCPLTPATRHLIDARILKRARPGVMIVNTSRGALIDAGAVIAGLKSGHVGYLAIDVYEQEADLFFEDLSNEIIQDDVFQRLLTFPNVIVTGHQAFFTREALASIANTTLRNIAELERGQPVANQVRAEGHVQHGPTPGGKPGDAKRYRTDT